MRTLYYQPTAGIAGDLHLAALIDLGVPFAHIEAELRKLGLAGQYGIDVREGTKMGIGGTRVQVFHRDQQEHRHYGSAPPAIRRA